MRLKEKILQKKGSSLVAVLMFLFIFITLSSGLLMLSTQNRNRSKKIETINSGYYDLDRALEKTLLQLDNNFERAEVKALTYIKDQKYMDDGTKTTDEFKSNNVNKLKFFNINWKKLANEPSNNKTDMEKYNKGLDKFCTEAFGRLYYTYLEEIIDEFKIGTIEIDKDNNVNVKITVNKNKTKSKDYGTLKVSSDWGKFKPDEKDFEINIEVVNTKGKKINAVVRPMIPVYNIVKKEEKGEGIRGNPIYANAITAGGGITFKKDCNIAGDIYSSNKGIIIADSKVDVAGNVYSNGDLSTTSDKGMKSEININRREEPNTIKQSIFGNNIFFERKIVGSTEINKYTENNPAYKTNTFFIFNDGKGGNVYCNNMIMGNSAGKDSKISIAGNISTKGSVINDSLYGDTLIGIGGNYIGISPYIEDIYTDYYGYEHGTVIKEDNFGSYIENNIYDAAKPNIIKLGAEFIVPGIKPLNATTGKKRSYESISCNFWNDRKGCILNAYSVETGYFSPYASPPWNQKFYGYEFSSKKIIEKNGIKEVKIVGEPKGGSGIADLYNVGWITESFVKYINGQPSYVEPGKVRNFPDEKIKDINTNIEYVSARGYCATSAILSKNKKGMAFFGDKYQWPYATTDNVDLIKNNDSNEAAYRDLQQVLKDIFDAKTAHFGTATKVFTDSVDIKALPVKIEKNTEIRYLSSTENTLEVSGNESGIVYSKGNLLIKGTGTFSGTIICEGDVTVNGAVDIKYDEDVIKTKLLKKPARDFFKPGEMGADTVFLPWTKTSENSVDKKSFKRYKIINWKQMGK